MGDYQLRCCDETGKDTGELVFKDTLEEGMEEFLSGRYGKLSWTRPNGQRIQLFRRADCHIEIVYPGERWWAHELVHAREKEISLADIIIGERS